MQPLHPEAHGPGEELWPARVVARPAIVAGIPPPVGVELPDHVPHPMATRLPAPGREPLDCAAPGLPRRAAFPRGLARTGGAPAQLKAAAVNAGAAPGLLAAQRDYPRLVRRHFPPTLAQPWPQLAIAGLGVGLLSQRGHLLLRVADQPRLATTAGLDHLLKPPVAGIVPIPVGQDRRADAAWRGPRRRMHDLAVGLQHAGRQPLPPPPRTPLQALFHHPDPPAVRDGLTAPLDGRFHHDVVRPTLALDRQLVDGVPCSTRGPLPIATAQAVLLVDGVEAPRDRALPQLSFHGRAPERAALPVALRAVVPLDACGAVALPLASRHQVAHVLLPLRLVRARADVIHAVRRRRPDVLPTPAAIRLLAQLLAVAKPVRRWLSGLLRSPLHEGGHWGPALLVRSMVPVPAASAWQPRPQALGSPVSESSGLICRLSGPGRPFRPGSPT
jgi:hypothetical protein